MEVAEAGEPPADGDVEGDDVAAAAAASFHCWATLARPATALCTPSKVINNVLLSSCRSFAFCANSSNSWSFFSAACSCCTSSCCRAVIASSQLNLSCVQNNGDNQDTSSVAQS
eukprot:TRINITY_DN66964_c7_g1_i1.p1 TRINITY_DN66964_c7_g1~~TRINITY_DN66964_c7_g1_i1.p1  ORF type:complete len:114 (+),score=5.24 TRINITY_DN66964_c7_g1_i1:215-556(+)